MRPLKLRVDSLVYVYGTTSVDHDLTGVPILVALPPASQTPAVSDFEAAEVVSVVEDDGVWTARFRILVGPGGALTKGPGLYEWTVKLTDTPEAPVFGAGKVQVTAV